jgi:hypothetical protein
MFSKFQRHLKISEQQKAGIILNDMKLKTGNSLPQKFRGNTKYKLIRG